HAGAQDRQRDDEACEARHHDQDARRDRQDRQQPEHLNDVADGGSVGLAETAEIDLLGECGVADKRQGGCGQDELLHSNSNVLINISLAWPPLRIEARSPRSALRCWKPLAPSIWCILTVRTKASRS